MANFLKGYKVRWWLPAVVFSVLDHNLPSVLSCHGWAEKGGAVKSFCGYFASLVASWSFLLLCIGKILQDFSVCI